MSLAYKVKKAAELSPVQLLRKMLLRIVSMVRNRWHAARDCLFCSFSNSSMPAGEIGSFFGLDGADLGALPDQSLALEGIMRHRFDVLGSGPVSAHYGVGCAGFGGHRYCPSVDIPDGLCRELPPGIVNRANADGARSIWRHIERPYRPIDWQRDLRSGYRWSARTWYRHIRWGRHRGVDVKVPWELARCHHLPRLALAYAQASRNPQCGVDAAACFREFRNMVLDFVATNPPRFGVNWCCSMDVAIRMVNWLTAYDLFRSSGATFDHVFARIFKRSIYDHGLHIMRNLEWHADSSPNGNHYLANVVGLLFAGAFLPCGALPDAWLAFGIQELISCVEKQFNPDGSNFEASTNYHRLSGELVVYGAALVLGLPDEKKAALKEYDCSLFRNGPPLAPAPMDVHMVTGSAADTPLPGWLGARLAGMARFTSDILWADGTVPQIGDNDSGRLLKIIPSCRDTDHRSLLAAIGGIVVGTPDVPLPRDILLERDVVRNLAKGRVLTCNSGTRSEGGALFDLRSYPDFGVFSYRRDSVRLLVRCGSIGLDGAGGHAHNDQLSLVLAVGGMPVIVDPGSFVYTALPEQRNLFRSTAMHNTLQVEEREQNTWPRSSIGLFLMNDECNPRVLDATPTTFRAEHDGFGLPAIRTLRLSVSGVEGTDSCETPGLRRTAFHIAPGGEVSVTGNGAEIRIADKLICVISGGSTLCVEDYFYSPAYGVVEEARRVVLSAMAGDIRWRIDW